MVYTTPNGRQSGAGTRMGMGQLPAMQGQTLLLDIGPGVLGGLTRKARDILSNEMRDIHFEDADGTQSRRYDDYFLKTKLGKLLISGRIRETLRSLGVLVALLGDSLEVEKIWEFLQGNFPLTPTRCAAEIKARLQPSSSFLLQVDVGSQGVNVRWKDGTTFKLHYTHVRLLCAFAEYFFCFDTMRWLRFLEDVHQYRNILVEQEQIDEFSRSLVVREGNITGLAYAYADEMNAAIHVRCDGGAFGEYYVRHRQLVRNFTESKGMRSLDELGHDDYYELWETLWRTDGFRKFDVLVKKVALQQSVDQLLEEKLRHGGIETLMVKDDGQDATNHDVYLSTLLAQELNNRLNPYQQLAQPPLDSVTWVKNKEYRNYIDTIFACRPITDRCPLLVLELLAFTLPFPHSSKQVVALYPNIGMLIETLRENMTPDLKATIQAGLYWLLERGDENVGIVLSRYSSDLFPWMALLDMWPWLSHPLHVLETSPARHEEHEKKYRPILRRLFSKGAWEDGETSYEKLLESLPDEEGRRWFFAFLQLTHRKLASSSPEMAILLQDRLWQLLRMGGELQRLTQSLRNGEFVWTDTQKEAFQGLQAAYDATSRKGFHVREKDLAKNCGVSKIGKKKISEQEMKELDAAHAVGIPNLMSVLEYLGSYIDKINDLLGNGIEERRFASHAQQYSSMRKLIGAAKQESPSLEQE